MTVTIELAPAQANKLRDLSQERGVAPDECATEVFNKALTAAEPPSRILPEDNATIALLESWIAEGAKATPAEIEEAERELQEFKGAMNESRRAVGARILYP